MEIARMRDLKADLSVLMALCDKTENDIRSCLSVLQFVRYTVVMTHNCNTSSLNSFWICVYYRSRSNSLPMMGTRLIYCCVCVCVRQEQQAWGATGGRDRIGGGTEGPPAFTLQHMGWHLLHTQAKKVSIIIIQNRNVFLILYIWVQYCRLLVNDITYFPVIKVHCSFCPTPPGQNSPQSPTAAASWSLGRHTTANARPEWGPE